MLPTLLAAAALLLSAAGALRLFLGPAWVQRFRGKTFDLLWECDFEAVEALIALRSLCWGAWLLLPWNTFAEAPATYRAFSTLMPEWAWGILLLAVGLAQFAGAITEEARHRAPANVAACMAWAVVSVVYFWSNPLTAAGISHSLTAVAAAWVALRTWEAAACPNLQRRPTIPLS
jgi:hypothetical protein